jgi:hypothetical protein
MTFGNLAEKTMSLRLKSAGISFAKSDEAYRFYSFTGVIAFLLRIPNRQLKAAAYILTFKAG